LAAKVRGLPQKEVKRCPAAFDLSVKIGKYGKNVAIFQGIWPTSRTDVALTRPGLKRKNTHLIYAICGPERNSFPLLGLGGSDLKSLSAGVEEVAQKRG
jgi:hypothetical protein